MAHYSGKRDRLLSSRPLKAVCDPMQGKHRLRTEGNDQPRSPRLSDFDGTRHSGTRIIAAAGNSRRRISMIRTIASIAFCLLIATSAFAAEPVTFKDRRITVI